MSANIKITTRAPRKTALGKKLNPKSKYRMSRKYDKKKSKGKQLVTRNQVKRMINADKNPEYLKEAIGLFSTSTVGTQNNFRRVIPDPANSIYTNYKVYKINMPTGVVGPDTNTHFGNGRANVICLKRITCNFKVIHSRNHNVLFKWAVIRLKGSNSGDYANFLSELEANRIINIPGSYVTPNQNRVFQKKVNYKGMFKIEKQRTLLLKAPLDTSVTDSSDPYNTTSISYSKTFGPNGKQVKFDINNVNDAIGSLDQYILVCVAIRADGSIISNASANSAIKIFGTRNVYWEDVQDSSEPA